MATSIVSIFVEMFMILPFGEGWCDYTVATRFYLLQQDAMNCNFLGLSLWFLWTDGETHVDLYFDSSNTIAQKNCFSCGKLWAFQSSMTAVVSPYCGRPDATHAINSSSTGLPLRASSTLMIPTTIQLTSLMSRT